MRLDADEERAGGHMICREQGRSGYVCHGSPRVRPFQCKIVNESSIGGKLNINLVENAGIQTHAGAVSSNRAVEYPLIVEPKPYGCRRCGDRIAGYLKSVKSRNNRLNITPKSKSAVQRYSFVDLAADKYGQ